MWPAAETRLNRFISTYVLLACLILQIVGLETLAAGYLHHLVDGLTVIVFSVVARVVAGSIHAAIMMLFMGGVAWILDASDFVPGRFDIEAIFWVMTHLYLSVLLARKLFLTDDVRREEIVDSISLYLASGIAFADLYAFVVWTLPGALVGGGHVGAQPMPYDQVLYYSFITQATLGYGDIVPTHRLTRTISILQSLYGVMFTAIVIARLLTIYNGRRGAAPQG